MKYLIAGLGNIGEEYSNTRHNIGFNIADALAEQAGASFLLDRLAHYTSVKYKGRHLHIIKPTTYMNLSGGAVRYWMQELKIPVENTIVLLDEIALPFGTIRIRAKGSDGGHNGLKNIQELLGTQTYPRLRFGVGNNFARGKQVDYVLGKWSTEELKELPQFIKKSCEAVYSFCSIGLERTMNIYND